MNAHTSVVGSCALLALRDLKYSCFWGAADFQRKLAGALRFGPRFYMNKLSHSSFSTFSLKQQL